TGGTGFRTPKSLRYRNNIGGISAPPRSQNSFGSFLQKRTAPHVGKPFPAVIAHPIVSTE
ncbi:hypothetical protein, partial [Acidiphilium sp.]|uniref:hypothetical protein n=1 Tax=Acidiphilium sp. TaxID=527 RepID=UPI003D012DA9